MGIVSRFKAPLLVLFSACLLIVGICLNPASACAEEGSDSNFIVPVVQKTEVPEDYVGIYTAEDLDNIRNDLKSNYILMEDIDLSGRQWEPIAGRLDETRFDVYSFTGTLDGNGHIISNVNVKVSVDDSAYGGLFGSVVEGTVKNLGVRNVSLVGTFDMPDDNTWTSGVRFGGITARSDLSEIWNCWTSVFVDMDVNTTGVSGKNTDVGGVVGVGRGGTIECCIASGEIAVSINNVNDIGNVDADMSVGGIAGVSGPIDQCANYCNITSQVNVKATYDEEWHKDGSSGGASVGGVVGVGWGVTRSCNYGWIDSSADVRNEFGDGCLEQYIGGIIGVSHDGDYDGSVPLDSFNAGDIRVNSVTSNINNQIRVGGLVGIGGETAEMDGCAFFRGYNIGDVTSHTEGARAESVHYVSPIVGQVNTILDSNDDFVANIPEAYHLASAMVKGGKRGDSCTELSASAMQQQSSFTGWDFDTVWQMGGEGYPYPTLRMLATTPPDDPDTPKHFATDPLVQLATCELAAFNPGSSWVGKTVDDFLASAPFQANDKAIWKEQNQKYSDFFSSVLKGYEFVSANGEGSKKHVALKDPATGDIVLALDPNGIITYASSFNSLLQSETKGCFDGAMEVCREVKRANPDAPIHVTGGFLGGMAASYVSNTSGSPSNVFNASAGYGAKLSWLTQGEFVDGNNFEGIDRSICTNYYGSSMRLLYGYGTDVLSSFEVNANPGGSKYRLNSLYEATGDGFALCSGTSISPAAEAKTFYIADTEAVLKSVRESVNNLDAGKPDLSFAMKNTQLTLGTTGKDVKLTGMDDALGPYNMFLPQIMYTGSGQGDMMRGSQTADIFVAGPGSSRFVGNEGSDLYVIGDDADVRISDTCASDGNVLCKGLMGVMKTIVFTNLEQPDKAREGLDDVLDSAVEILKDTRQDTIVFRNCSFDDMEITLVDAPFPNTDYYEIKAGSSTVQVQKRFFLKRDFLLVDASASGENARKAEGKNLEELYEEKNGLARASAELYEADPITDASNVVTVHLQGTDVAVSVRDTASGDELFAFSSADDLDYCDTYGTYTSCAESGCIDAAYDASKVNMVLTGGDVSRIATNATVGDIEGSVSYRDRVFPGEHNEVEVRANDEVRLIEHSNGSENQLGTDTITTDDIDNTISTEAKDISEATISEIPDQEWAGIPITPSIEASFEGVGLVDGVDYDLSYEGNAGVGGATVIVTGKGLFTGEKRLSFAIYASEPEPQPQPAAAGRLGGADRYKTMALVSQAAFPQNGSCGTVVIARGDDFPDALAAAGLAGVNGGQVLLTQTSYLTADTKAEIKRLGATKAYVIGDKNSVSDRAFNEVRSLVGGNITRLGGASRYETALEIYKAGEGGWGKTAIVAIGTKAPDALSASPVAYAMKAPIFLADDAGNLSKDVLNEISNGGFDTVLIMGSKYSVSASAEKSLRKVANAVRFSGEDRYETSQLVAGWALRNGFTCKSVVVTAGYNGKFADALVASSLGGKNASPLLLADNGPVIDRQISKVIEPNKASISKAYVIGDENSLSNATYNAIQKAIS